MVVCGFIKFYTEFLYRTLNLIWYLMLINSVQIMLVPWYFLFIRILSKSVGFDLDHLKYILAIKFS